MFLMRNQDFPVLLCSSPHLEKGLLLLHVFVDEWQELLRLSVSSSTPVLLPAVLLLQTLQHPTHLQTNSTDKKKRTQKQNRWVKEKVDTGSQCYLL